MFVLMRMSKGAAAMVLLVTMAQWGCGQDDGAAPPVQERRSPLFGGGTLWPESDGTHVVPVCWETGLADDGSGQAVNPHTRPDWGILSATVRDAMLSSWGRVANIEFVWFLDCPSNSEAGNGGFIAINMAGGNNSSGGNTLLGYRGPSAWTRMRLDPASRTDMSLDPWLDFRGQVMHETGHALGFPHENDRADNPRNTGCPVTDGNMNNNGGPTYGTAFDLHSIMNYSYDQGPSNCTLPRPYRLSKWDIIGAQNAYGRRTPGQLVAASGSCLDIPLPYSAHESLQIFQCHTGTNQAWQLQASGPYWGKVYNPAYDVFAETDWTWGAGHEVAVGPAPTAGMSQAWGSSDGYQIRGIGDLCLDVPDGQIVSNQYVQIYSCNGGANQRWKAFPDGTIRPIGDTSYCLDVPWGSASSGNGLQLYPCHGGAAQQFTFEDSGEIRFQGLCVDVRYGTPDSGNPVQLYSCKSGGDPSRVNQLWHLTMPSMRAWNDSNWCLGVQNSASLNHTPIVQSLCNGSAGQEWDYHFKSFVGF